LKNIEKESEKKKEKPGSLKKTVMRSKLINKPMKERETLKERKKNELTENKIERRTYKINRQNDRKRNISDRKRPDNI